MTDNLASTIADIIKSHPEDEWLERCRKALPAADDGEILSAIEILSGGDVLETD